MLTVIDNSDNFYPSMLTTNVIKPGANLGFGSACNLGASRSNTPFILFLNPDVQINSDVIEGLLNTFSKEKRGIWGPLVVERDFYTGLYVGGKFGLLYLRKKYLIEKLKADDLNPIFICGACMMTTKLFFDEIGGFDEKIFLYAEDLDICLRATKVKGHLCILKKYEVQHKSGTSSSRQFDKFMRFNRSFSGHFIFLRKKHNIFTATYNALYLASGLCFKNKYTDK
jgi:GT2 family glycosyltransferase